MTYDNSDGPIYSSLTGKATNYSVTNTSGANGCYSPAGTYNSTGQPGDDVTYYSNGSKFIYYRAGGLGPSFNYGKWHMDSTLGNSSGSFGEINNSSSCNPRTSSCLPAGQWNGPNGGPIGSYGC